MCYFEAVWVIMNLNYMEIHRKGAEGAKKR